MSLNLEYGRPHLCTLFISSMQQLQEEDWLLFWMKGSVNSHCVTAKTATPTKVDSELSDAHLESLKRREGEGECH